MNVLEKSNLRRKQLVANEIYIFFKILKFSAPTSLIIFIVLYTIVFKIQYSKNPDLSGVHTVREGQYVTEYYGNTQNGKVWRWYKWVYTAPYGLRMDLMEEAHKEWVEDRTIQTIIVSGICLFGIPLLIIIGRLVYNGAIQSKKWISENKTI